MTESWQPPTPEQRGWTLDRHILELQRQAPNASGEFTTLFQQIALAGKIISSRVNQAGLADVLGITGDVNIQGETVQKLDMFAHRSIIRSVEAHGLVCVMASEEIEDPIFVPPQYPVGKYVLMFDPLDGSSNIDVNVSIGTIFSIHRRVSKEGRGDIGDCLQPGYKQVAAGYIIYGSSTMFVYTLGQSVHGFTLDPSVGEFFLSHENIKIPKQGKILSVNEGNTYRWLQETKDWVQWLKTPGDSRPYASRYIGTLVSDFHRTLLRGGVFAYPGDHKNPEGKLRLLYECAPLAFIAEAAGGAASTGKERVLDIVPSELHQRVPLFIGDKDDVQDAERFLQGQANR